MQVVALRASRNAKGTKKGRPLQAPLSFPAGNVPAVQFEANAAMRSRGPPIGPSLLNRPA